MKRRILLFALALVAGAHLSPVATAKPVSMHDARRAVAVFLHVDEGALTPLHSPWSTLHLFAVDGRGFAIAAADDRVLPVLGYSLNAPLKDADTPIPENMRHWLDGYDAHIQAVTADESLPPHPQWALLLAGSAPKAVYNTAVGPLMTTTWGQFPYYNDLCPSLPRTGEQTVTGCVATAMGQVMKYWNWPASGVGSHQYTCPQTGSQSANFENAVYDWQNMPDALTALSDSAQVAAVATLLYHCGVSVDMYYGSESSAYDVTVDGDLDLPCAENALRTYFKYSPALFGVWRETTTDDDWTALMKNEMDHRRPVLYGGASQLLGGHEFVCDGYDTNGFFHFNWGYDGLYDGFFSLADLTIEDAGNFNSDQAAIFGIEPDTLFGSAGICTVTAVSSDPDRGSVSGSGTYAYRDTVTLTATPAERYRFYRWSNGATFNPYPMLAHDANLEALFVPVLVENNDTLSYTGPSMDNRDFYSIATSDRYGIRIPAADLRGHDTLKAVDLALRGGTVVVNVHFGGNDAPGPVAHVQQFYAGSADEFNWFRIPLDSALYIPRDSNLWITVQIQERSIIYGALGINVPDANWYSNDGGATWGHLTDYDPTFFLSNPNVSWYIRCITSSAGEPLGISPVAASSSPLTCYFEGLNLRVENPGGETLRLYDITGRCLSASSDAHPSFSVPAPGVYILRAGTRPALKVVAVKQ